MVVAVIATVAVNL